MINNSHIPPAKKKIGASLNISIENKFFIIGIRPVERKTKPERYASRDLVMI
tara:strand:+ start:187 stop:342 length:156 start_codon:yes stop_codon:yes gene_type:complete